MNRSMFLLLSISVVIVKGSVVGVRLPRKRLSHGSNGQVCTLRAEKPKFEPYLLSVNEKCLQMTTDR